MRTTKAAKSWLRAGLSALLLGSAGCVVVHTANIYDVCSGTEQCPGATTCQVANATVSGYNGTFCTVLCNVDADCPPDGSYAAPVCIAGQCYAGCPSGGGCPYAEACGQYQGVYFCVP